MEKCPLCMNARVDPEGDHDVTWPKGGAFARHRDVQLAVADLLRQKEVACLLEKRVSSTSAERPADIWLPQTERRSQQCVDFVVTHTWTVSSSLAPSVTHHMEDVASRKKAHYGAVCEQEKADFIPFVLNTWGGIGREAMQA